MSTDPRYDDHDLPRDRELDAAWRAASRDEPSRALDAAILAAARRAVMAGPQRAAVREATRPQKPWWPLAAAASIGAVAFGILQLIGPESAVAPNAERATVTDVPRASVAPVAPAATSAPAPTAAPEPAPMPAKPQATPDAAPAAAAKVARERRDAPTAIKDSAAASPPRSSEAASDAAKVLRREAPAEARQAPAQSANDASPTRQSAPARDATASGGAVSAFPAVPATAPAAAPAPASSGLGKLEATPAPRAPASSFVAEPPAAATAEGAPAMRAETLRKSAAPLTIDDWVARIRKLRDEGRTEELAREVAAFRAAYPNEEKRLNEALTTAAPRQ